MSVPHVSENILFQQDDVIVSRDGSSIVIEVRQKSEVNARMFASTATTTCTLAGVLLAGPQIGGWAALALWLGLITASCWLVVYLFCIVAIDMMPQRYVLNFAEQSIQCPWFYFNKRRIAFSEMTGLEISTYLWGGSLCLTQQTKYPTAIMMYSENRNSPEECESYLRPLAELLSQLLSLPITVTHHSRKKFGG